MMIKNYPQGYIPLFLNYSIGNFCFYSLRSLLVLYLTSVFLFSDGQAFDLYGTFMALSYLTPVFCGWLSDSVLGTRFSILVGGSLVFIGCLLFLVPQDTWFILGLMLLSLGIGFLKPTTLSAVGSLFPDKRSAEKDGAYTTLYVGMNIGSALGPLICGWIGHMYGWHFVFPLIGGAVFLASLFCCSKLKSVVVTQPLKKMSNIVVLTTILSILGFGSFVCFCLVYSNHMNLLIPMIILSNLSCLGFMYQKSSAENRRNLLQIGGLMILFALFCSVFEQAGSSMTLFIDRCVDRSLLSGQIPTESFQSLNPFLVIIIGSLIARGCIIKHTKDWGVFEKFLIGFLFTGLSFFVLGVILLFANARLISPLWIVLVFSIQVMGEFYIIPIGFSAVSKLSPQKYTSFIMGLWSISIACGHYIASLLAKFSSLSKPTDIPQSLDSYQLFFTSISFIPFSAVLIIGIGIWYYKR